VELPLGNPNTSDSYGQASSKENAQAEKKSIIASLLAQSSRHLFGPTSAPNLPLKHQVVSIEGLLSKLSYLKPEEITEIKKAFHFSDTAHLGQYPSCCRCRTLCDLAARCCIHYGGSIT